MSWIASAVAVATFVAALGSMWFHYQQRQGWSAVDARLTSTKVVSYQRWSATWYRLQAEYTYTAQGQRYYVPFSFPRSSTDHGSIEADRRRLDGSRLHRVFYDPANPNDMMLDLGATRFLAVPLVLALISITIAGTLLISYMRNNAELCGLCGAGARSLHRFCRRCGVALPLKKGRLDPEGGLPLWWLRRTTPKPHNGPVRYWGRRVAVALLATGAVLLGYALWESAARLWVMASWKSGTAEVMASRVVSSHDGNARLVFQVEATLRRDGAVEPVKSDFFSRDYAWIKQQQARFQRGSSTAVWSDPKDGKRVRFGAGWAALISDGVPEATALGVAAWTGAGLCGLLWRRRVHCGRCRIRISRHDAFCPFCGKSEHA